MVAVAVVELEDSREESDETVDAVAELELPELERVAEEEDVMELDRLADEDEDATEVAEEDEPTAELEDNTVEELDEAVVLVDTTEDIELAELDGVEEEVGASVLVGLSEVVGA